MREIPTEIEISATPEEVWDVLLDFESYSEWNPVLAISGEPREDAMLEVKASPTGGRSEARAARP